MISSIALFLAIQQAGTSEVASQWQEVEAGANAVMDATFDCMDEQIRLHLREHIRDANPETTVDAAMAACSQLRQDFANAVSGPNSYISEQQAIRLADDWFASLRETYVENVDNSLASPELAQARTQIALLEWRQCVTERATDWSRLEDEAATIGQAAVTSCRTFRPRLIDTYQYELRSRDLPPNRAAELVDRLEGDMTAVAIETVVSERASRLR